MKINVGFLVSYDYELLKISIPAVYNNCDNITLALDENLVSWSGNSFKINNDFFDWVEAFDVDSKISIYRDNFYIQSNTAMENEVRERNLLAKRMGGGYHIQIDADEVFLDFLGLTKYLKKNQKRFNSSRPVQICGYWSNIYKKVEDGYLFVKNIDPFYLGTNRPNYSRGRKNIKQQKYYVPFIALHLTWGRSKEALKFKLENWGHNTDFDTQHFLEFWESINKHNFNTIERGFHPLNENEWKELIYVKGNSIEEILKNDQFPKVISNNKRFFKNLGQRIKFILKGSL